MLTTFRLSSTAQGAASTAATTYKNLHDAAEGMRGGGRRAAPRQHADPRERGLVQDRHDLRRRPTISLHSTASSLVLGRLSVTEDYTKISVKETAEPSSL